MNESRPIHKIIVIILIAILLVLSFLIIKPIMTSIIVGIIGAYIFYPVYRKIHSWVKYKNVAATIATILAIFIIILPIALSLPVILKQTFSIYTVIQNINIVPFIQKISPSLLTQELAQKLSLYINSFITKIVNASLNQFADLLTNLPTVLLNLAIVVFVFFFAVRDKEKFEEYLKSISPFSQETQKEFSQKSKDITYAVIYGHFIIGVVQGLVTGIGLLIFGVPNVLTLTLVSILLSILPILGSWLIWLPVSLVLIAQGSTFSGVGLLLYGLIIVSWIDNIIRPLFISWKTDVNSALVLIGMIGGLLEFGILGLIIGPLIVSYLLVILEMYRNRKFDFIFFQSK